MYTLLINYIWHQYIDFYMYILQIYFLNNVALMGQCDTMFPKLAEISGYSSWLVDRYDDNDVINCLPFEDTTNFYSIASYLLLATRFWKIHELHSAREASIFIKILMKNICSPLECSAIKEEEEKNEINVKFYISNFNYLSITSLN